MNERELLNEFFVAENERDWDRYVMFLHPDIEWTLGERVVRGRSAYRDAMVTAYADSGVQFRLHQVIESSDSRLVATLLIDSEGNRSVDIFEFEDGLIRREWEFLLGPGADWNCDAVDFHSELPLWE